MHDRLARRRVMRSLADGPHNAPAVSESRRKNTAMRYQQACGLFDSVARVDGFIWERTQRHGGFAAARARGIPTIAVAHNIESLVADEELTYAKGGLHDRFAAECAQLALADHRFVISERDQWLLSLFGIDSSVLPYYPPQYRHSVLATVRARRNPGDHPRRFLIMGSAYYPPTYEGMRYLLRLIIDSGVLARGITIDVMGFGSERLRQDCDATGIRFHGAVSDAAMFDLMAVTTAAIIYQHHGTGALTRVVDFLLAGVPILANPAAARSYEHLAGVSVFFEDEDLLERLNTCTHECAPDVHYPQRAAERFLDTLHMSGI
ncbi:hypothetical protein S4A8_10436 [Salinisphaera sp. S4-8]